MTSHENPTNTALWAECMDKAQAAHPAMPAAELRELTAKSYEYEFLERLCPGEPYTVDTCAMLDEFFKAKWEEQARFKY